MAMSNQPGPYELSIMLFDATGKAVRPVFSRKVPAEIGERVFDVLTAQCVEEEVDAAGEIHRIVNEPECTCYEIIGGHQQGCAFYGVKA